jgi:hypothetical protein
MVVIGENFEMLKTETLKSKSALDVAGAAAQATGDAAFRLREDAVDFAEADAVRAQAVGRIRSLGGGEARNSALGLVGCGNGRHVRMS